jgi:peptidoglycan/LPS O-acetylase OafA/YrhL
MISRENNFDLLRLLAALQVLLMHASVHLEFDLGFLGNILENFSGVTIFFTISGFLITMSYDRNRKLKSYFRNRFLRIYPALWVCLLFTIILMLARQSITFSQLFSKDMGLYVLSQMSFFQFWTPDILRSWGVGTPNGSLWTIPVEIEFYIILPLIFLFIKKIPLIVKFIILFVISYLINFYMFHGTDIHAQSNVLKLITFSLIPHLFNFMLGGIMYCLWTNIKKYIENKGLLWFSIFIVYILIFKYILNLYDVSYYPNLYGLIHTILLSVTVISLAFTAKKFSDKILAGNDISYGIYIYHMPIINCIVAFGERYNILNINEISNLNKIFLIVFTFIIVLFCAFFSWKFIEKKALKLKKR